MHETVEGGGWGRKLVKKAGDHPPNEKKEKPRTRQEGVYVGLEKHCARIQGQTSRLKRR